MQLKLRRSQREAGLVSTNVIFCLDARADLTQHERSNLSRYKLYDQVIYNSEASRRHLDKSEAAGAEGSMRGSLKSLAYVAMAALRLNITVRGLERGQHIECKSLDELLAAEDAIMEACQNLRKYLEVAGTFNGTEMVLDFSGDEPRVVAQAIHPEPILAPPVIELTSAPLALDAPPAWAAAESSSSSASNDAFADALGKLIDRISDATGLDDRRAKLLAIGVVVLLLVLLVSMCHG